MPALAIFAISIFSALLGAGIAWGFFRLKNQHLVSEAQAESGRELVAIAERLKAAENLNVGFRRELEKAEQIREELENRKILLEKNISMLETTIQKDRQQTEEKIKLLIDAKNKLSSGKGNLISRAEKIRELGAKTSKCIPPELISLSEDVIDV
jgi:DNA anti-recombination protein RmuC